jgi:tRNA pseudouridine13 synthase
MKLKVKPEDFRVEERLKLRIKRGGLFSVYRLEKRLWNTLDVVRQLEQKYGMRRISRAGLKDRYSCSVQYLSIPGRGPRLITEKNYSLRLAGMADEPVSRDVLLGNSFDVTLRALKPEETAGIERALPGLRRFGFPNYYDEQRMGSARHGKGFIARRLVDGHLKGALKLWLGTPSSADDNVTRRRKTFIEEHWGEWKRCLEAAPPEARPALGLLARRPRDLAGAVALIPRSLLELFVSAYQAWLWNEILAAVLSDYGLRTRPLEYAHGTLLFYDELTPEQQRYLSRLVIPAPGPDAEFRSERVARIADDVLARAGTELRRLKLKVRIQGVFFKAYERAAVVIPEQLQASKPEPDEIYPGCRKLTLSFFLPSGSFATMLVKRLSLL